MKSMNSAAKKLGTLLLEHNKTLSTAESCTGGMVAKAITDIPGSSRYFMGGVVSYSNEIKTKVLHVDATLIEKYGAVSKQAALAMAKGVQKLMKTDCAIAVTGIAGPEGGTRTKPVGLVYIAVACAEEIVVNKYIFNKNRDINRRLSTNTAINLLIDVLTKKMQ